MKTTLVALALLLALLARVHILRQGLGTRLPVLARLIRPEAVSLVAVLAAAGLLSNVAPPFDAGAARAAASRELVGAPPPIGPTVHLAGQAGWLQVYLAASLGQLGMQVIAPNDEAGGAANGAGEVRLRIWAERPRPHGSIDLFPRSCGSGCYRMRFTWYPGTTYLHVEVGSERWAGGTLTFAVT
jgi:copper transport protein